MKVKKQKPTGDLRRFLDAQKVETVVTGPVDRWLLARDEDFRRQDILHPSELCKSKLCDLAVYYRIAGKKAVVEAPKPRFQLQRIYDQGTEIHLKWQGYLTGVGLLEGEWECPSTTCGTRFWACAPRSCPKCNHVGRNTNRYTNMIYKEVPLNAEASHHLVGHADGKIGRHILEIKSIGIGTLRVEAPGLLAQNTYKTRLLDEDGALTEVEKTFVDWDGLWKGIKRPLNSHQRQAHLYVAMAKMQGIDVDSVVFLYESKWVQATKEFVVPYNPRMAEPLLDKALDLKYALEKKRPPACPFGGCEDCARYTNKEQNGDQGDTATQEPAGRARGDVGRSGRGAGETGPGPALEAGQPRANGARRPLGAR